MTQTSLIKEKRVISQGVKNKRKGSTIERFYATLMQNLGFTFCKTTRACNRMLDNCKVDLAFLPIHLQIKAGYSKGLNEIEILKQMEEALKKNYPEGSPELTMPRAIVHHRDMEKGRNRRIPYDVMVTMTFDDFIPLLLAFDKQRKDDIQNNKRTD